MKISPKFVLGCLSLLALLVIMVLLLPYLLYWSMYHLGGDPSSLATGPDGRLYIADKGQPFALFPLSTSCVWVVDTQNDRLGELIKVKVPVGTSDIGVAANGRIYLGHTNQGFGRRSATLQPGVLSCNAASMLALPNGHILNPGSNDVLVVDAATDQIVEQVALPERRSFRKRGIVAISDHEAYVLSLFHITRLDLDNYQVLGHIAIPGIADAKLVADQERELAYLATGGETARVLVLDTRLHQVVDEIAISGSDDVVGLCLTPAGKLYVLRAGRPVQFEKVSYDIQIVSPQRRQAVGKIMLPEEDSRVHPSNDRIAIAPNGKVYVLHGANTRSNLALLGFFLESYVIVIDPQRDEIVGTIPLRPPLWARLWPFDDVGTVIALICLSPAGLVAFVLLVILLGGMGLRSVRSTR